MAIHCNFLFENVELDTPVGFVLFPALVLCMSAGIHQKGVNFFGKEVAGVVVPIQYFGFLLDIVFCNMIVEGL